MKGLSFKQIAYLFEPDMERMAPGYLITWFMDNGLIDISQLIEDDGIWDGYIWYN